MSDEYRCDSIDDAHCVLDAIDLCTDPIDTVTLAVEFGDPDRGASAPEADADTRPDTTPAQATLQRMDGGHTTTTAATTATVTPDVEPDGEDDADDDADAVDKSEWLTADEDPDQDDVSLETVRPTTSLYDALSAIVKNSSPDDPDGVPATELGEHVIDTDTSSAASQALDLYRKLLVERRKRPGRQGYTYRPTQYGVAHVDKHGPYEEGDRHKTRTAEINVPAESIRHWILSAVDRLGGGVDGEHQPLGDIAAAIGSATASPSSTCFELASGGYLDREPCPTDAGPTTYKYRLTDDGQDVIDDLGYHPEVANQADE